MSNSLRFQTKPKPSQRKGFLRFADQIKNLKTNVFRTIDRSVINDPGLYAEGVQSYFQDSFEKHLTNNLTEDFHTFAREIQSMIKSLPLLLFHKKDIIDVIIKYITKPNFLAVDCLLDLITCLARDLLDEFYPFFLDILQIVVDLIDLSNSKRIEQCFTCIGYMFKFLRKLIIKDIKTLFSNYYYQILSHKKEYIRQFSAESFAFLLRNVKNNDCLDVISYIFSFQNNISSHSNSSIDILLLSDGLVNLFFESIKGVDYRFHSKLSFYYNILLQQLHINSSSWCFSVLFGLVKKMCIHTNKDHSEQIFIILINYINQLIEELPSLNTILNNESLISLPNKRKRNNTDNIDLIEIEQCLEILHYCISYRNGYLWIENKNIMKYIFNIIYSIIPYISFNNYYLQSLILSIISSSLIPLQDSESESLLNNHLPNIMKLLFISNNLTSSKSLTAFSFFLRELMILRLYFGKYCLYYIIILCNDYINDYFDILIHLLYDTIYSNDWNRAIIPSIVRIAKQNRINTTINNKSTLISTLLGSILDKYNNSQSSISLEYIWITLRILSNIELPYTDSLLILLKTYDILKNHTLEPIYRTAEYYSLLSECFLCIIKLCRTYEPKELELYWDKALMLIQIAPNNINILSSILTLIQIIEQVPTSQLKPSVLQHIKSKTNYDIFKNLIVTNLSSSNQELRIITYKLLIHLDITHTNADNSLLSKFLLIEETPKKSMNARISTHILSEMEAILPSLPQNNIILVTHALLGCLHIKYSPIWPIAIKNISILCNSFFSITFEILYIFMEKIHDVLVLQSNQVSDFKKQYRHILGQKKHKPAGLNITAQLPSTIKTPLEENIDSYEDNILQDIFINSLSSSEIRLGILRTSTDIITLHSLLWKIYAEQSINIESVSKRIIPFFLSFMKKQYIPIELKSVVSTNLFNNYSESFKSSFGEESTKYLSPKILENILLDYLKVFALFNNPKTLKYSSIILEIFELLISYCNTSIQKATLQCILRWKFEYLNPYRENLERLTDDKTIREEMTSFNLTIENEMIKKQHREGLSRIIIYILHGKLISIHRKSKLHKHTILSYLGGFEILELKPLFSLLLQSFNNYLECLNNIYNNTNLYDCLDISSLLYKNIHKVTISRKNKLLLILKEIFRQFGKRIEYYLPNILNILIGIFLWEYSFSKNQSSLSTNTNTIKNLCIKRLSTIVHNYPNYSYDTYFRQEFYEILYPLIKQISSNSKQITPTLDLLNSMIISPQIVLQLNKTKCIWLLLDIINSKASTNVLSCILQIIEHLIDIQNILYENNRKEDVLIQYVNTIILKLDSLDIQASSQNILVERILQLLSKLAQYATNEELVDKLLSVLLTYLSPSYNYISISRKETLFSIILSLQKITTSPESIIEPLSYQLLSISEIDIRKQVLNIFNELSNRISDFTIITDSLENTNAYSTSIIGSYDYDKRSQAFIDMKQYLEESSNTKTIILPIIYYYPIVYNCLYYLSDTDISIRNYSEECLIEIIHYICNNISILNSNPNNIPTMILQVKLQQYHKIIYNMIFPWIKKIIRKLSQDSKLLGQALRILHECISYSDIYFQDMKDLIHPNCKFFLQFSVSNTQEQINAITKLKQLYSKKRKTTHISLSSLSSIIIPLLFNRMLHTKTPLSIQEEIILTLANICYHFSWNRYYKQLLYFISSAKKLSNIQQKQIIRLCCFIFESFHYLSTSDNNSNNMKEEEDDEEINEFEEDEEDLEDNNENNTKEKDNNMDIDKEDDKGDNKEDNKEDNNMDDIPDITEKDKSIMTCLTRQIIPKLLGFMQTNKTMISTNIHICLAVVKVLQVLPQNIQNREIPKLFKKIITNLRSRDQIIRDDTRETLLKVLQALGAQYFSLVLRELLSTLTKGYQLHILGYTIHYLLYNLQKLNCLSLNCFDNCIKSLSICLLDDIIGEAAQKKEVDVIRTSMKETKQIKSFESYTIISRYIGFASYIQELIHPIYSVLISTISTKIVKKMITILQKISIGLTKHSDISYDQILIFLYSIINENLQFFNKLENEEKSTSNIHNNRGLLTPLPNTFKTYEIQKGPRELKNKRQNETDMNTNVHVLAEFALGLLFSCLKRNRFNMKDDKHIEMLNPFISLLISGLDSLHENSVLLSLKCLNILITTPLPSLDIYLPIYNEKTFNLIQKTGSKSKLMNILFKSQLILLRNCHPTSGHLYPISLDNEQIKYLLSIVSTDIDNLQHSNLTFSLLKAIVLQKIIIPELYDLMKRISEVIVSSQILHIRQTCSTILLNFLLYYPLGENRLQQHIDFILKNISYYSPEGRQSILDLINQIIIKFPKEFINNQSEYMYFSLVLSLVNDDNSLCREMSGNLIKLLLENIDYKYYKSMYNLTIKWINDNSNISLQRVAAQLLGLFIETSSNILNLDNILEILLNNINDTDEEENNIEQQLQNTKEFITIMPQQWHIVYYCLISIEKLLKLNINILEDKHSVIIFWKITQLMLHSHAWIRMLCGRIFGLCFSSLNNPKDLSNSKNRAFYKFISKPGISSILAKRFCLQFKGMYLTDIDVKQIIRNLLFLCVSVYYDKYLDEQSCLPLTNKHKNKLYNENREDIEYEDDNNNNNDNEDDNNKEHILVHKTFRVLSFTARRKFNQSQTVCGILKFYAGMVIQLSPSEYIPFLIPVISPLYHASTFGVSNKKYEDIVLLAEEVSELIKKTVGTQEYLKAYQIIRKNAEKSKLRRKTERKIAMIKDPKNAIKEKQIRNLKSREKKKHKIARRKGKIL